MMRTLKVGIDSYPLSLLSLNHAESLEWARANHAAGIQFSDGLRIADKKQQARALTEIKHSISQDGLFVEWGGASHIPIAMQSWQGIDTRDINLRVADEAAELGVKLVRSCSGGFMRWQAAAPSTDSFLQATAENLCRLRDIFRSRGLTLAIETHFEFTTHELLRLFDLCGAEPGDWLGICLDTLNVLVMLEDPAAAAHRVMPWVVSVHCKDGIVRPHPQGFEVFPVALGKGLVDFSAILGMLNSTGRPINLVAEDHGGTFVIPSSDKRFLARFPDFTVKELHQYRQLAEQGAKRAQEGKLQPLSRSIWPRVGRTRMQAGLLYLQKLVERL